jgi:putative ABC transport system permease protein
MFRRLWNVLRQRRIENEIREEMGSHLALLEEEELARGASAQSARRNARLRFGNDGVYQEQTREADLTMWLDDLLRDIKFAGRQLLRNPGFTVAAVLLLGLGIGVNAAIFTVISSVILRPLALPEPERLVSVLEKSEHFEMPESWPDLLDLQAGNRVFESSGAFTRHTTFVFRGSGDAMNLPGSNATPGYFATMKVQPIAGRLFAAAETQEGAEPVALIREDFWKAALNADPEILRKTILLDGRATQVIGILPAQFRFPASESVIWTPIIPQGPAKNRGYHDFSMVGRLKPGVTMAQAQTDLQIIMHRLASEYPDQNKGHDAKVLSFQDWSLDKRLRDRLMVLQIATLALFLMACANISSLLLARNSARRREFEIRLAMGSSRSRQIRQHLTESLLLTGAGCVAAIGLAAAGVHFLVQIYGDAMPRAAEISPDWRLVGAVIPITLAGAIAMGLATVLHGRPDASGLSAVGSNRASADRSGVWTRKVLVVFQLTCAVVLLTSTASVLESFWQLLHVDVGFDRSRLVAMRVSVPPSRYKTGAEIGQRFAGIAARVGSVPGVRAAAAINLLPVSEWGFNGSVNVEGMPGEQRDFFAEYRWITKDYLRTMGIPLLRGRQFLPEELAGTQKAAIVNQTMARELWGGRDPIGAHINMFSPEWITVVGIVRDVRQSGVTVPASSEVFMPAPNFAVPVPGWSVLVRSDLPADSLMPAIRSAIAAEEREAAVDRVRPMDDVIADTVSAQRIVATLLACFAVLALVLASLGLYSVLTFTVAARLPELAIRAALGSTPRGLIALVSREGIALIAVGLGLGLAAMIPLQGLLRRFIFDVAPLNGPLCAAVLAILLAVGATAVAVPAFRASRIDPIRILRGE